MGMFVYSLFPFLIAIVAFIMAFLSERKYRSILLYAIAAMAMIISADLSIISYPTATLNVSAYNITTSSGIISIAAHNITAVKPMIVPNLLLIYMMPAALFAILCMILALMQAFSINPKAKLMG